MTTTFDYDSPAEVNTDFLKAIKTLFKNQRITITVNNHAEMDETEYLLSDEQNRELLYKSLKQAENGEVVRLNFADL